MGHKCIRIIEQKNKKVLEKVNKIGSIYGVKRANDITDVFSRDLFWRILVVILCGTICF